MMQGDVASSKMLSLSAPPDCVELLLELLLLLLSSSASAMDAKATCAPARRRSNLNNGELYSYGSWRYSSSIALAPSQTRAILPEGTRMI